MSHIVDDYMPQSQTFAEQLPVLMTFSAKKEAPQSPRPAFLHLIAKEDVKESQQLQISTQNDSKEVQDVQKRKEQGNEMLRLLKEVARAPTLRIPQGPLSELTKTVTDYKQETHQTTEQTLILGKRLKGIPSENENKKRLRLNELKEFEEGKRVLSPSIFRKSKGPIILSAQTAGFVQQLSASQNIEISQKSAASGSFKRPDQSAIYILIAKDVSLVEYDVNSCMDLKDMHQQTYKCFDNYLSMVSQLYFGLPIIQNSGKGGNRMNDISQSALAPLLNKSGAAKSQQQMDSNESVNGSEPKLMMNGGGSADKAESRKELKSQQAKSSLWQGGARDEGRFKLSTFDQLISPLRVDNPFEIWAPKEIALFEVCMCTFGKNFCNFSQFIKTKSEKEIIDFYQAWKKTQHYKCWKSKQDKRRVTSNQNEWVFQ